MAMAPTNSPLAIFGSQRCFCSSEPIPLGRGGTPEEAADAVYLFCSPESNYISGQVVVCGGGLII